MFCIKYLRKQIRRIFKFKSSDKNYVLKQIIVIGGYGFGNTGDEAQCNETLKLLTKRYSNYQIKVLSPNPNYTMQEHSCFTAYASRVSFYNQGYPNTAFSKQFKFSEKVSFIKNSLLLLLNAYFVRADLPTLLINARKSQLLQDILESKLVYISGGGFLTGETLSRLLDGIIISKIAEIFKTPVVMSGQTIGIWKNKFIKYVAKWGFKKVKIITVRDEKFSLSDLKEIDFGEDRCFATHDDALFCEKATNLPIVSEKYISLNFHYWGMSDKEKNIYINKIHKIVTEILSTTTYKIVFIPMHKSDKNSFDDYISKYPNARISCFEYDYDFRKIRNIIANSEYCITMKHHPIIFAMGEDVPVISLAFSQYYIHKNIGALQQYGMEKYSVNLENTSYLLDFKALFKEIIDNRLKLINTIQNKKQILILRKEKFLSEVDELLEESI